MDGTRQTSREFLYVLPVKASKRTKGPSFESFIVLSVSYCTPADKLCFSQKIMRNN